MNPGGAAHGARLALERVRRALDPPQRNANAVWRERLSLELSLRADDGWAGRGEAAPLPAYSRDSLDQAHGLLAALPAAELAALAEIQEPRALIETVAAELPEQAPSARFALETALLDRAARRAARPLWQLLAALALEEAAAERPGRAPAPRAAEPVALAALLPSGDPQAALALALRHHADGVTSFKLKVGPERLQLAQDATFERLRAELGDAVRLRADANGSLSRDALGPALERLAAHGVDFLEEPLASARPEDLAASPCPLALDESLQNMDPGLLARWLALPTLRVLVLKPTTLGGFGACVRLAGAARASGREVVVSHAFEGPIGWAACAHLALALGGTLAAGLWPLAHQAAPAPRVERGRLISPSEPGLGALE